MIEIFRMLGWILVFANFGYAALYPDMQKTPGEADPKATKEEICQRGYATKNRHVTQATKKKVYELYGITDRKPNEYQIDHLISLCLGGTNSIKNLWPQPILFLDQHNRNAGAIQKDVVEKELCRKVCKGELSLEEARDIEVNRWFRYYKQMKGLK